MTFFYSALLYSILFCWARRDTEQGKEKGVLYLGRIPHGFYEEEMKAYFSQFGDISRLRLARNKKVRLARPSSHAQTQVEEADENIHVYLSVYSSGSDGSEQTFRLYRDAQQERRRDYGRDDA